MSEISLILVLQNKTNKTLNDMAKIQIKSEKLTPLGGIFSIMEQFDALLAQIIDSTMGLRCTLLVINIVRFFALWCAYIFVVTHVLRMLQLTWWNICLFIQLFALAAQTPYYVLSKNWLVRTSPINLVCFQIMVNYVHIASCQQLIECGINLYIQKEQLILLDDEGHPSLFAPIMIAKL